VIKRKQDLTDSSTHLVNSILMRTLYAKLSSIFMRGVVSLICANVLFAVIKFRSRGPVGSRDQVENIAPSSQDECSVSFPGSTRRSSPQHNVLLVDLMLPFVQYRRLEVFGVSDDGFQGANIRRN
jgi:hypothetical protein